MLNVWKRLLQKLKSGYRKLEEKSRPWTSWILKKNDELTVYLNAHPKVKFAVYLFGIPTLLFFLLLMVVLYETPGMKELRNIQNQVASEVYSADSVLLGRYFVQDRTVVEYDEISPVVMDALIATEDIRFYNHEGVDYFSLGRVLVKSIFMQDETSGGGSTLTQQLSKNLYPRKSYWVISMLINKMREAITAQRLESIYSKKELITMYLNTVPFGDNAFGIQAASKRFFSTQAANLSADQAAILIGMLKATTSYNPRLYPKKSQQRRNVVLSQMVKYKFLSKTQADSLKKLPLELKYNASSHREGLAPYFKDYLKSVLLEWCENNKKEDGSSYNLDTDGLKIYTTLDSKLQAYAEQAVAQQMAEVQQQFFQHWGKEKPWGDNESVVKDAITRSNRYQSLQKQGLSEEEIMKEMSKPVRMRVFTWSGEEEKKISPIDSIIHHLQYLNAGFLAVDPSSGQVKAWVGGIDHDFYQYDHVKPSTKRQVGSIFKPFVYATAIEHGTPPCELISAGRETYIDDEGEKWTPKNMQNDYEVKYSMRGGLAYSVNTVAVKLIQEAGVENTIDLVRKMGITSEIPTVPSIALGSSSISLMEMVGAYACLANEGVASYPYFITSITDLDGKVYDNFKPGINGTRALSKETALQVRHMLQTVVYEGTASRIRWKYGIYNDIAGKTGTTQANADGWFMGFTPKLVMGSWVGADDPRIRFRVTNLGQGSNTALPIVGYFMRQINGNDTMKEISGAKFQPLPVALQRKLNCDLYELNENLQGQIVKLIHQRDSILMADSLAKLPKETFLEVLYKRKQKILQATQQKEDDNNDLDIEEDELGG